MLRWGFFSHCNSLAQESSAQTLCLICSEIVLLIHFPSWVASGTKGQGIWDSWLIQDQNMGFTCFQFSSTHIVRDHRTFGIQSPINAIGSGNWKQQNMPVLLGRHQQIEDQEKIRSMKEVLQSSQSEEARRSRRYNESFLDEPLESRVFVCCTRERYRRTGRAGWCCAGKEPSSALVYTISTCVYEGYYAEEWVSHPSLSCVIPGKTLVSVICRKAKRISPCPWSNHCH